MKALKKLSVIVVSFALTMSLLPINGLKTLADESNGETPAATSGAENDKPKETAKPKETTKPKETAKPKETEKPAATQATEKPAETEAPKETAKPKETEKPAETGTGDTEQPKDTEPSATPAETGSGDAEQPKETEPSATPAETGSGDAEQPKETEPSATPAETGNGDAEQPKETEPSETPAETGESETEVPKETEGTEVPAESGNGDEEKPEEPNDEATGELPDDSVNAPAKNASMNTNLVDKILTFDAVDGAYYYELYICDYFYHPLYDLDDIYSYRYIEIGKDDPRRFDLGKIINCFIKEGDLDKTDDDIYYYHLFAYDSDYNRLVSHSGQLYHETSARPITVGKMTATISNGNMSWKAVRGATLYLVSVSNGFDYDDSFKFTTTTTSITLNSVIDQLIRERLIFKYKNYYIYVKALDGDEAQLAYCSKLYTYNSSAVPKAYDRSISASISGDYLYFTKQSWATKYDIRVVDSSQGYVFSYEWIYNSPVNIYELIDIAVNNGDILECPTYTIEFYACDSDGDYLARWTGTYKYKDANTLSVAGKTAKVKKSKVRKKNQNLAVSKVIRIRNRGQGTLSYRKLSGNKKIVINARTGKVTVKKKIKKGTYKVTVLVRASGDDYHVGTQKKVTFKIKVK